MGDFRRFLRRVERLIEDEGIGLVILDTASKLLPVDDENDSGDIDRSMGELALLTEAGASVIVTHHDRKCGGDPVNRMRGSGSYAASADVLLSIEKMKNAEPDDPRRVIYGDGRFDEVERELVVELNGSNFIAEGSRAAVRRLDAIEIVAGICGESESGLPADAIWKSWPEDKLIARPRKTKFYDLLKSAVESDHPVLRRSGTGRRGSPFLFRNSPYRDESRMNKSGTQFIHSHDIYGGRISKQCLPDKKTPILQNESNGRRTPNELCETTTNGVHRNGSSDPDRCPF